MSFKNLDLQVTQQDIIIAVMGATGAGKSSFISVATRNSSITIGHNLRSCTRTVQPVRFGNVVFLDTPGFNDTNMADVDILAEIASWLTTTYRQGIKLTGLLFLHRISDNRMTGTSSRNTDMFKLVCGADALQNVVLVTTMWDEVDKETGLSREEELRNDFWKPMIDAGSKMMPFYRSYESAWEILDQLSGIQRPLLLQVEIVDKKRSLSQTSAGVALLEWLERVILQIRELIDRLQALLSGASKDPTTQEHEEKLLATKEKLKQASEQKRKLVPSPVRSFSDVVKTAVTSPILGDRPLLSRSSSVSSASLPSTEAHGLAIAAARTILKRSMAIAEASELPILKGVISLSRAIVERIEAMKRNEKLLVTLVNGILQFCSLIDEHEPIGDPSDIMIRALEAFYEELKRVEATLSRMSSRGRMHKYILHPADEKILAECSQRIEDAYYMFTMRSVISIYKELRDFGNNIRNGGSFGTTPTPGPREINTSPIARARNSL